MFVRTVIIGITCLIMTLSASASEFIFDWQPFVIESGLSLQSVEENVPVHDLTVFEIESRLPEKDMDSFHLLADHDKLSEQKSEKKSVWQNIKFDISASEHLISGKHRAYHLEGDDQQLSNFVNAITSLIYESSKVKSLENIGTIIEPQINFYFEF